MPKPYTSPTLYNEALQIHISKLKDWGYLAPGQIMSGVINWSRSGNPAGSISITANTYSHPAYIELNYNYRDEHRNYKVYLACKPSNLNKGVIWFFMCPKTYKYCRKLYSIGGFFMHREAFRGAMYEIQTHSKRYRQMNSLFGGYFKIEALYTELHKKYFKKTYAGKPTKKYLRIMEQIQKAESIPYHEIERAMLG